MSSVARISVFLVSIVAVVVILSFWKKHDRATARAELESRFAADLSVTENDFSIGCSSPELVDLAELAELVARLGEGQPTILDLTGAPALVSLAGIERFTGLKSLVAIDCGSLVSAEGVKGHPSLTELVFTDSAALVDVSAVQGIRNLTTLDFSGCLALTHLDLVDLPALENLYLSRCQSLQKLDVSEVTGLRQLYTDGCVTVPEVVGLSGLTSLTDLDVSGCTRLKELPGIRNLATLIVLDIRNVDLQDFSEIAALPKLRILRMGGQDAIETLEPFTSITSLRELHLEACPNLHSLKGMPPGVSQYAGFNYCPKLVSLDGIEAAKGLEQLDVTGCEILSQISALSQLSSLRQLNLVKCRQVMEIRSVEKLSELIIVMLGGSGVIPASVKELALVNEEMIFDFSVAD
ncbi:MAG: hypothetical protein KBF76_17780 [Verrucomicrobiales bacterium]|nr:hypothetical protein [Verrucomicrobiales bacterium]